jgi:hypothetical protein
MWRVWPSSVSKGRCIRFLLTIIRKSVQLVVLHRNTLRITMHLQGRLETIHLWKERVAAHVECGSPVYPGLSCPSMGRLTAASGVRNIHISKYITQSLWPTPDMPLPLAVRSLRCRGAGCRFHCSVSPKLLRFSTVSMYRPSPLTPLALRAI